MKKEKEEDEINRKKAADERAVYYVNAAVRGIFSNTDMSFGVGVVILDTSTKIGELVSIALQNKGVKTVAFQPPTIEE